MGLSTTGTLLTISGCAGASPYRRPARDALLELPAGSLRTFMIGCFLYGKLTKSTTWFAVFAVAPVALMTCSIVPTPPRETVNRSFELHPGGSRNFETVIIFHDYNI
jgi:hypothetical protein